MSLLVRFAESAVAPDFLIRSGIRMLNGQRLRNERRKTLGDPQKSSQAFAHFLRSNPIAVDTKAANEQHYEVPTDFFQQALGKRVKYSCCYYTSGDETLDQAEEQMLRITCQRASLSDGMDLLELGCGWGSLTLWMAEHFPNARITAVSNSATQREYILLRCREQGLRNIDVVTADMNSFHTDRKFDRILSVEMFEHMRNYERLMKNIASWMKSEARLFVHLFCHRDYAYLFETEGSGNWMGRHFFTGGIMPSYDLLLHFQNELTLEDRWCINGMHYRKTAEQWLQNMDLRRDVIMPVLRRTYGTRDASLWFRRWRIFFMACAELWGFRNGGEWMIAHYVFRKRTGPV
jgi:cyclopropane-fatty-acyl-phospholipid synthase